MPVLQLVSQLSSLLSTAGGLVTLSWSQSGLRSLTEPVWPMIESNWSSRAAEQEGRRTGGYKKVCCQYFLTKSQCETAQCPGLPWSGSTNKAQTHTGISLSLSLLCPAQPNTRREPDLCWRWGETKRQMSTVCWGGDQTRPDQSWLDINPSCDAVTAWPGLAW